MSNQWKLHTIPKKLPESVYAKQYIYMRVFLESRCTHYSCALLTSKYISASLQLYRWPKQLAPFNERDRSRRIRASVIYIQNLLAALHIKEQRDARGESRLIPVFSIICMREQLRFAAKVIIIHGSCCVFFLARSFFSPHLFIRICVCVWVCTQWLERERAEKNAHLSDTHLCFISFSIIHLDGIQWAWLCERLSWYSDVCARLVLTRRVNALLRERVCCMWLSNVVVISLYISCVVLD